MARVTIEDSLLHIRDQFALVHLTAKRYRELHRGSKRMVDCKNKDIIAALREIAAGKVAFREDIQRVLLKNAEIQPPSLSEATPDALDEINIGPVL
ncbi:DNA-directed RNA polymerase subunit omega [Myxococcota bacterium]|nr:DNA-directed RNA polymerase subunit omega [Myxococcota bacterium]MBU1429281.1 DNA-directed RNA polymerase subunit omega [Myxococcota bacterium]MBU1898940.1 DNA-directed RNA polymerase subunit omega [Myxococcota bacterium]